MECKTSSEYKDHGVYKLQSYVYSLFGTGPVSDDFSEPKYQIFGFRKGYPVIRLYFNVFK